MSELIGKLNISGDVLDSNGPFLNMFNEMEIFDSQMLSPWSHLRSGGNGNCPIVVLSSRQFWRLPVRSVRNQEGG